MVSTIIVFRARPTEASRRTQAGSPSNRKKATQDLCAHFDVEFLEQYYSISEDEGIFLIRGSAELAPVIQATLAGSGAFDYVKTEIIVAADDMLETRESARTALLKYKPADQDEIDRMLLDE